MTDCNTSSSNISGTPIAGEITQVGSNLSIDVVQAGHGFTAGNVIRFDTASNGYTLAQANNPQNAEVCGVVSAGTITNSIFNFVMAGDIVTSTFASTSIVGSTAEEVFFLSAATAGVMDSTPPLFAGAVLKTIIVRLPSTSINGVTQDKGIVKNYVGNYLGGDSAVYMSGVNPVGSIHAFVGNNSAVPIGWAMCDGSAISVTTYPHFSEAINNRYGFRERITFIGREAPVCQRVEDTAGRVANVIEKTTNSLLVEHVILRSGNLINNVRGENGQASYSDTNLNVTGFPLGASLLFIDGTSSPSIIPDTITLESVLTPDFRNKFIMGATGDSASRSGLNVQGGSEKIDMNLTANQSGSVNYGVSEPTSTGLTSIENIPPYISVNWIVRVGDSSYTSFIDQLSLARLSLTGLPISDPNISGSIYSDGGTLKVSAG